MGSRPYTGFDGNASSKRAGTERFIQLVQELSGGGVWNNGSWGARLMRGKSRPSVHGTGRAMDLSWRGGKYGGYGSHAEAQRWIDFFVAHAAELEIELLIDYFPGPYGCGYKCDRDRLVQYTKSTVKGAPGGDWIHIEISPRVADDADYFDRVLPALYQGLDVPAGSVKSVDEAVLDAPGPENYPGHVVDEGHDHDHEVKAVQEEIGVGVDGDFGPITKRGVESFQKERNLPVTGVVDEATWSALFGVAPSDTTTTVEAGDGWWQLAERSLGDSSRWRELAGLNGGEDRVLHVGDVIMLPAASAPSGGTIEVRAGDSWWKIAQRELGGGSRWVELAAINGGEDRVLLPGDEINLP